MSFHDLLLWIPLLFFLAFPVFAALRWGDRIAEAWDRGRLRQRRGNRIPLPRSLPGREELLTSLRSAENRCTEIDQRISESLLALQRVTVAAWRQRRSGSASDLLKPAGVLTEKVPRKEETLNLLLDVACLQSDRIDAMTAEVDALSQAVGWRSGSGEPPDGPPPSTPPEPGGPAAQLLRRIEDASRKRRSIDDRLKQMKAWKPSQRPSSQPPPASPGPTGSRFDVTIQ